MAASATALAALAAAAEGAGGESATSDINGGAIYDSVVNNKASKIYGQNSM